jgi:hypothetical protein
MAIVDRIDWERLDRLVENHQRNREVHTPVISLFRWWARRPHAVIGAILDAAMEELGGNEFIVSDPFSGGGTVAFESVRRGLRVYAQDLYHWPIFGLATGLGACDPNELQSCAEDVLRRMDELRCLYRGSGANRSYELSHVIRVRIGVCSNCKASIFMFGEPFLSLESRKSCEKHAFFGCMACGEVRLRPRKLEAFKCDSCGHSSKRRLTNRRASRRVLYCPGCCVPLILAEVLSGTPRWKPVLVQEISLGANALKAVMLRPPMAGDPISDVRDELWDKRLRVRIPAGLETNHLLRHGFSYWSDLYTSRQLRILISTLDEIAVAACSEPTRNRLFLAALGACEMPAYLCRWSRTHPKAFEALANHRYSRSTVVTETNLLSPVGRGTLHRRFRSALKGLLWLRQGGTPKSVALSDSSPCRRGWTQDVVAVTGSSDRQLLRDRSVGLVLTDPPYHDDVQYGELARLFHLWLRLVKTMSSPAEYAEAAPNAFRRTTTEDYEKTITQCLSESRRTLTAGGKLILTFHNNSRQAWSALASALMNAGYQILGLATVSCENSVDHSKRGKRAFLCDLVLECVPRGRQGSRRRDIRVCGRTDTEQRKNLLAVGLALANCVKAKSLNEFEEMYKKCLMELGASEVLIS